MILGLCGSFAVLPAMSLATGGNGGNGASRGVADPPRDPPAPAGARSLAALLASNLVFSAATTGGAAAASDPGMAAPPAPDAPPGAASNAMSSPRTPAPRVATPVPSPAAPTIAAPRVATPHASSPSRSTQGVASWLAIAAGTCANNDAPMGATITVTNGLGVSVSCRVVSRGPFVTGRVVDLSSSNFTLLGSLSRGLVSVTVTW